MDNRWVRFINGENVESEVSPAIYRSWQRSMNYHVNPRLPDQDILSTPLLFERKEAQEPLIMAGKPVMPYMYKLLRDTNYSVLLADKDGFIIEAMGEGPFISKAQLVNLSPGAGWNEEIRGTNAIGTVLQDNTPLIVSGQEHFVQQNHFMACWAAPIQNSQGRPIGVLDISGDAKIPVQDILSLVTIGAGMIEKNLQLYELEGQLKFYQEGLKLASSLLHQGFIVIDRDGIIRGINLFGAAQLGRKQEDIIGKSAEEIFCSPKAWKLNAPSIDLYLKDGLKEKVSSHLIRVNDKACQPLGAIGTLQTRSINSPANSLWIGHSQASKRILERAAKVAATNSSVLIHGESGTGKEIIAHTIHQLSPRHDGPFVALNCASLPASLVESELFGYVEGAFTGARRGGKPGKFEMANKGTIFLDEIGDMPLNVQVSLLRVLQEKEVSRIGDTKANKIDVRVIAASHKNLGDLVAEDRFRLDLYYRLKVVTLDLPPLRERPEDIRDFVPHFIRKACESLGRPVLQIEEDVYAQLSANDWPGNVRELENCIESMVALAERSVLTIADLPEEFHQKPMQKAGPLLDQQTKNTILYALTQTKGKIAPAAKLLGIGRNTLYRKIKELDIKL